MASDTLSSAPKAFADEVDHPGLGRYWTVGSPLRFSGNEGLPPKPAPELGQHTDEVLAEFGLTD
jgi:crotonobetainyl-CoA:carnitine CoA-transferase CaiB-like acyl-CoA transferase